MIEKLLFEVANYIWLIVAAVLITVLLSVYLSIRTKEFSWDKKTVRIYGLLYDLDTRGIICFSILIVRLIMLIYIAATGGTNRIGELVVIEIMTLAYAIVSGDSKSFMNLLSYLAIYAILLMESLFLAYYQGVEKSLIIMFLIITFGLFGTLYSIHQSIVGYEGLINICAERDKNKYDKDSEIATKSRRFKIRKRKQHSAESESGQGTESRDGMAASADTSGNAGA